MIRKIVWSVVVCVMMVPGPAFAQRSGEGELKTSPVVPEYSKIRQPDEPEVDEEFVEESLKKATLLFKLGKIDAAVLMYYDILNQAPNNLPALEGLLDVFFTTKNWAMIISTLEQLTVLKPDDRTMREMLVLVYNYYQMPESALKSEIELSLLEPENQEYLSSLALKLGGYGLIDETIDLFERLHDLQPENVEYMTRLAALYEQQYRLDTSIAYYERVLSQTPDDFDLTMRLAQLYRANNQPFETLHVYSEALHEKPENPFLLEEVNYVHADIAKEAYYDDRLALARTHFSLSAEGEYPYPFGPQYLREVEREMAAKTFYTVELRHYAFPGDITNTLHTAGVEAPIWGWVNRVHAVGRYRTVEDGTYAFPLYDGGLNADIRLHDRIRAHVALDYSMPGDGLANVEGALLYANRWAFDISRKSNLEVGIKRTRITESIAALDKNIFHTEYSALLSYITLNERLWTALEYQYGSYTGGNDSHFANFDVAYTPVKWLMTPDDLEAAPPLREVVKHRLTVGANVEYVTFAQTLDFYSTHDEMYSVFVRGGYDYSPIEHLQFSLRASTGVTSKQGQTITDVTAGLRWVLPLRLYSEVSYTISDDTAVQEGQERTSRSTTWNASLLFYF